MGERKVLNKYYPPDLENFKLPKLNPNRCKQYVVRLMIPFTMRCKTCGNHIYHGKKFNARKETVEGEKYLGMPIFRFYIRCPVCLSEISFKTDPENTDYAAEAGAYRTFQAEAIAVREIERKQQEKEEEEANNPMLALENRTKESRREMDILDVLEEIKDINAQQEGVSFEQLMEKHLEKEREESQEEEQIVDALAKAVFQAESKKIKRIEEDNVTQEYMIPSKKSRHEDSSSSYHH
uniref:Splicing factor YJU2 n=1 Tax=Amphimedon queenslandica TaxID=400682 RepID=A0A1X7VA11_AMPQE